MNCTLTDSNYIVGIYSNIEMTVRDTAHLKLSAQLGGSKVIRQIHIKSDKIITLIFCGKSFAVHDCLKSLTHRHQQTFCIYLGDVPSELLL